MKVPFLLVCRDMRLRSRWKLSDFWGWSHAMTLSKTIVIFSREKHKCMTTLSRLLNPLESLLAWPLYCWQLLCQRWLSLAVLVAGVFAGFIEDDSNKKFSGKGCFKTKWTSKKTLWISPTFLTLKLSRKMRLDHKLKFWESQWSLQTSSKTPKLHSKIMSATC